MQHGRAYSSAVAASAVALAVTRGCSPENDAIPQAEKTQKNAPGFQQTRAIAELNRLR